MKKRLPFVKLYWKNWSTADDLRSLARWEQLFGANFHGLFVFAYDVLGDRAPLPAEELFQHRQKLYGFVAVPLSAYLGHARMISPRWDTLAMPTAKFRHYARPLGELLGPTAVNVQNEINGKTRHGVADIAEKISSAEEFNIVDDDF
ncbi:MAG: HYExAFE family protein [Thermoguttaceae bacterium]